MIKSSILLLFFITNLSYSATLKTKNTVGGITTLTEQPCRFNRLFKEATSTNANDDISYACYWEHGEYVYFMTKDHTIRRLPKKVFML